MAGAWTKITVTVDTEKLDGASSIISMLDSGLMIEDYSDFSLNGMYGELVDERIKNADITKAKISLFVPEEKNPTEYIAYIEARLAAAKIDFALDISGMDEEDWADSWKKYFKPMKLGRATIVPSWEDYTESEGEVVVRIDPGMAFGTGTHETTRLVMKLLEKEISGGEAMLDVGSGSGILSILAAKLGAGKINAYDIDPVAVRVARENVRLCGCDNITVGISDLLSSVERLPGGYDLCVANIVADIIIRMLPDIGGYLKPGAKLILSGIVAERESDILECASALGYKLLSRECENDWVALLICR